MGGHLQDVGKMRETLYESVEALQGDLDEWLIHQDTERPHLGYRNERRRSLEIVKLFASREG